MTKPTDKLNAAMHGLTAEERAWVEARVAEAPPLTEEQARLVSRIFSNPLGRKSGEDG